MVANIESGAAFQWANDKEDTAFPAHLVSRTGSYLSDGDKVKHGDPIAYLVAPPLEATFGIDAALKAADVQLATYVPPPSETNYSAAFLTGSRQHVKQHVMPLPKPFWISRATLFSAPEQCSQSSVQSLTQEIGHDRFTGIT